MNDRNIEKKRAELTAQFAVALTDCFRDEADRESHLFSAIDCTSIDGNELTLAMFMAFKLFVEQMTNFEGDSLDFINTLNHLLLSRAEEDAVKSIVIEATKDGDADE